MAVTSPFPTGTVHPRLLEYELGRRGKRWSDLPFSAETVRRFRQGRAVKSETQRQLGQWLHDTPVIEELDRVMVRPALEGVA